VLSQVTAKAKSWAFCLHFNNYQFISFRLGSLVKTFFFLSLPLSFSLYLYKRFFSPPFAKKRDLKNGFFSY